MLNLLQGSECRSTFSQIRLESTEDLLEHQNDENEDLYLMINQIKLLNSGSFEYRNISLRLIEI